VLAADAPFAEFRAGMERRFVEADARWDARFAAFTVKVEHRLSAIEHTVAAIRGESRAGLADQRANLLKWMFGFWIATLVPLAGLMVGLVTTLR
jgi:hypothetical protein